MAKKISRCTDVYKELASLQGQISEIVVQSGTTISVQDEGGSIGAAFDTLNFVGATVEATDGGGGVAVITITGAEGSQNVFTNIAVSGQSDLVADSTTDTLTIIAGPNIVLTNTPANDSLEIGVTGINVFDEIAVSGQTTVTASSVSTTLTLVAGSNVTLTTNNTTKTITIASSGGVGGGSTIVRGTLDSDLTIDDSSVTVNVAGGGTITAINPDDNLNSGKHLFTGNEDGWCAAVQEGSDYYLIGVELPIVRPV